MRKTRSLTRRGGRHLATELPSALFGAWDWNSYQTTLGALLSICAITFLSILVSASPVQSSLLVVVSSPSAAFSSTTSSTTSTSTSSSSYSITTTLLDGLVGFSRCLLSSMTCTTHGELCLLLATLMICFVDVERVLGSIKLRELIIILGLQRIFLQVGMNFIFSSLSSSSSSFFSSFSSSMMLLTKNTSVINDSVSNNNNNSVWSMPPSAAWFGVVAALLRRFLIPPRRSFSLVGIPLSEHTIGELIALQLCIVSADSKLCWFTCFVVTFVACSRNRFLLFFFFGWFESPIRVRSKFFPKLWPSDLEMEGATVLARFHST